MAQEEKKEYMLVKYTKSGRKTILERNLTLDEASRGTDRYKPTSRSFVGFTKQS